MKYLALSLALLQIAATDVPRRMRSCHGCHRAAVESYLQHGMSRSVGVAGSLSPGTVRNPSSGNLYEITVDGRNAWLKTTRPGGGMLRQPIVGRIGAGLFDTSWVTAEVDPLSLSPSGRLFFAPVETVTGHGLALSPFDLHPPSPGPRFGLTGDCLTCHTESRLEKLSGAGANPAGTRLFPHDSLGRDAFEDLAPLGCETCHGDTGQHLPIMLTQPRRDAGEIGLPRLSRLPPARQRDVCSRCHLQGDVRLVLSEEEEPDGVALAGRIPVLVPARPTEDHRFVGQMERLALSACFRSSPRMTCNTCHLPHSGVRQQGQESFDDACKNCHQNDAHPGPTPQPPSFAPKTELGRAGHASGLTPRASGLTPASCTGCHMRRSQPFDLPHVQTVDHFIQRRILPPAGDLPYRPFARRTGRLEIFDDGRLAKFFATPAGRKWRAGVLAMGHISLGRLAGAAAGFGQFAAPGTPGARTPTAPPGLIPLETSPLFHHLRADYLERAKRPQEAVEAYGDVLRLDPERAAARLARARLLFRSGDLDGALRETERIIASHPQAGQPWDLRAGIALRMKRPDLAASALAMSTQLAPSNAAAWHLLGRLRLSLGQKELARQALQRASALEPQRQGLAADLAATAQ